MREIIHIAKNLHQESKRRLDNYQKLRKNNSKIPFHSPPRKGTTMIVLMKILVHQKRAFFTTSHIPTEKDHTKVMF